MCAFIDHASMRWVLVVLGVALPATASAHVNLTYPPARSNQQFSTPCGEAGSVRGTNVTTLTPGATITVTWDEVIQHPGHYRIAFDVDGQDFTNPPDYTTDTSATSPNLIVDLIADTNTQSYMRQITLPNVTCTNCTLQLIQMNTDKPPYDSGASSDDLHFQCADISLVAAASDAGVSDAPGNSGSGGGGSSDAGTGEAFANPYANRGCSTSPGASVAVALFLLSLLSRRRRRR